MTVLTKKTTVTYNSLVPATAGSPGYPGTPPTPGYFITVNQVVNPGTASQWVLQWLGSFDPVTGERAYEMVYVAGSPAIYKSVQVWIPPTSGTPPVAPISASPGQPGSTTSDRHFGWNAGAVSQETYSGDVDYTFSVSGSSSGVVTGLSTHDSGYDYAGIAHAMYFTHGKASVYESGIPKSPAQIALNSDVFLIRRTDGTISYYKNDSLFYTSGIPSAGTAFADASLYAGGDSIVYAALAGIGVQPTEGQGGVSAGELLAIGALSANYGYSSSAGILPSITGSGGAETLSPTYSYSSGSLQPILGFGLMLTGSTGASDSSLLPLDGYCADRPYAHAFSLLAAMEGASAEFPVIDSYAALSCPAAKLYATGHDSTGENSAALTMPKPSLSAFGGANAKLTAPRFTLDFTGTATGWGSASLICPAAVITATGAVSGTGSAALTMPTVSLVGYMGAVCSITMPSGTLQASSTSGSVGNARLVCPLFELMASGTAQNYGSAALIAPAARLGATAQAWLIAPSARLTAIGTAVVAIAHEAYSINLQHSPLDQAPTNQVTHYTNYPFTHVVRYQNSYFGVAADGLYLLEGTTDDGAAIPFNMKTCMTDFGAPELKTLVSVYMGGRLGADETLTLHVGDTAPQVQSYQTPRGAGAQNHRQKFGKGNKARYYALGVSGEAQFALDTIDFEVATMKRRI